MIRSLILVVLLVVGLSSCGAGPRYLVGAAGEVAPGVPGVGPGAEAAKAWGSWEKAHEAFNRYVAQGMTPAQAAREAAKGPKGGSE